MALFRYEAVDRSGKVVRGAMDASDEQAVAQRLNTMGYVLKAVLPASTYARAAQGGTAVRAPAAALRPSTLLRMAQRGPAGFPVSVAPVVPLSALARFYRQLATLVRSGMPLVQSLSELTTTTFNRKLREACDQIKQRVQDGESLSKAMSAHPLLFPVHTVGLIWGGELGGYLDIALDEAATEIEQEAKDNRQANVGWWLAKVNIIGAIICLPLMDLGSLLWMTISHSELGTAGVLQKMGETAWHNFWTYSIGFSIPALIVWIALSMLWTRVKRTPEMRKSLDGALLAMPAWGALHRERARQRFLNTLFRLYEAAVPPAQAWAAASMSVRNSELASRLRANEEVMRQPGGTLQKALMQSGVFTQDDAGMVATGEKSGAVPEMLKRLGDHHGEGAADAKKRGRLIAWHALILSLIVVGGYLAIKVHSSYADFWLNVMREWGI